MSRVLRYAFLVAFLLSLACGRGGGGGGGAAARPTGPRAVQAARAEAATWQRSVELGGTLEAPERVEIAARIEGAVTSLSADLGDRVTRGTTLARITAEEFAARVAESEAELSQARADLTRAEQMAARELGTREAVEQAATRVRVLEAQRSLAGRQLRDTRVIAPFDGAIAERLVSPGAFVRVGDPLFVLVATEPLRLAIDVPEQHAPDVHIGTAVRVRAASGGEVAASILRIAPIVDPATRTFRAEVEVRPTEGAVLRPGMYVRAVVDLGGTLEVARVPRGAVFEVLGRARVVEIVDGRASLRDVELVAEDEGVAIVRGLPAGTLLVTRSPGLLAPGAELRVEDAAPEAAEARGESEGPRGGGT